MGERQTQSGGRDRGLGDVAPDDLVRPVGLLAMEDAGIVDVDETHSRREGCRPRAP